MPYSIREFETRDAQAIADLTLEAIRAVGAHRYTPDQVAAWAARHPGAERFLARAAEGHQIFVAESASGTVAAYSLLEPDGHLDMLYCHPDHTRRGLADALLDHSESHARAKGMSRLYTEASELARPAFERAGYVMQHRRDFTIEHDGREVAIHNYAMEKPLD